MSRDGMPWDDVETKKTGSMFNVDESEGDYILTPEDIEKMQEENPGSYPATRTIRRQDPKTKAMQKVVQRLYRYDALGRKIANNDVAAITENDIPIPHDRYAICDNIYGFHGEKSVFLGLDGFETGVVDEQTGKMHVLCNECLEHQAKRKRLYMWIGLGGILWNPEDIWY